MSKDEPVLYGRKWSLQVATDEEIKLWSSPETTGDTALNIGFKIQKNADLKSNDAEITVYNLSPESRAFMVKNANVELKAGYQDLSGLIFKGVIEFAGHQKQGCDWITTITARDGAVQWRENGIVISFKKGTPVETVIKKLIATVNLPPNIGGKFKTVNQGIAGALMITPSVTYSKSTPTTKLSRLSSNASEAEKAARKAEIARRKEAERLRRVQQRNTIAAATAGIKLDRARIIRGVAMQKLELFCASYGLKAIWADQSLTVIPINQAVDGDIVSLTTESGLIGSPEPLEKGGYKFVSLLRHDIKLFSDIAVTSAEASGIYRVKRVEHEGEYRGNQWYTMLECDPV